MSANLTKKLIINADDFGISQATNRAIRELFASKRITSCSLLACGDAADEAISIAKEDDFKVGVHMTLNSDFDEYPWRSLAAGSAGFSLADPNGNLFSDTKIIAKQARAKDVTAECLAQIKYVADSNVVIDHIDNHSGTMYGINLRLFFINAFRIARQNKLPFRFPKRGGFLSGYFPNGVPTVIKAAHKAIVFTSKLMRAVIVDEIISNPYPIKDIPNYTTLKNYYINEIINIKAGVSELFLHPSYHCPKLAPLTPEWKKREYELKFLMSEEFITAIKNEGIELISYGDI
ncbi:MAG: ChbG/HpnK family deacetylase [Clostridia bacterium]